MTDATEIQNGGEVCLSTNQTINSNSNTDKLLKHPGLTENNVKLKEKNMYMLTNISNKQEMQKELQYHLPEVLEKTIKTSNMENDQNKYSVSDNSVDSEIKTTLEHVVDSAPDPVTNVLDSAGDEQPETGGSEAQLPPHYARRPMNAFLIFCKRHRSVVRAKYPHLENRSITKILGEWWASLDKRDKFKYTNLAKEYKDAFFAANPEFKWYKKPAPPLRNVKPRVVSAPNSAGSQQFEDKEEEDDVISPPPGKTNETISKDVNLSYKNGLQSTNSANKGNYYQNTESKCVNVPATTNSYHSEQAQNNCNVVQSVFTPGKLADETQLGGLSSLINFSQNNNNNNMSNNNMKGNTGDNHTSYLRNDNSDNKTVKKKFEFNNSLDNVLAETSTFLENVDFEYNKNNSADPLQHLKKPEPFSELKSHAQKQIDKLKLKNNTKYYDTKIQKEKDSLVKQQHLIDKVVVHTMKQSELETLLIQDSVRTVERKVEGNKNNRVASKELPTTPQKNGNITSPTKDLNLTQDMNPDDDLNGKSRRACKGKRYREFMTEGKLLINKRNKQKRNKHIANIKNCHDYSKPYKKDEFDLVENDNLKNTIKKLAQRTNASLDLLDNTSRVETTTGANNANMTQTSRNRTESETSEYKIFQASDFDLDIKILALPALNLESFLKKKRDCKKKKKIIKNSDNYNNNETETTMNFNLSTDIFNTQNDFIENVYGKNGNVIGSRKRKARKESITRLETAVNVNHTAEDLLALTTLAEVAAKKLKIDDT